MAVGVSERRFSDLVGFGDAAEKSSSRPICLNADDFRPAPRGPGVEEGR